MLKHVLDFCAYGSYVEDHCGGSKDSYFNDEEEMKLNEIINREIIAIGDEEFIKLVEEKFKAAIKELLL
jgi:hypothetical protein